MKAIFTLIPLLLFTSCAMTQQDWQRAAAISGGSSQLYTSMEAQNMQRQNFNYQVEQERLGRQNNRQPSCDLNCRQRKHELQQQLLYLQMQNSINAANGYPGY